jgi:hypothetical protein
MFQKEPGFRSGTALPLLLCRGASFCYLDLRGRKNYHMGLSSSRFSDHPVGAVFVPCNHHAVTTVGRVAVCRDPQSNTNDREKTAAAAVALCEIQEAPSICFKYDWPGVVVRLHGVVHAGAVWARMDGGRCHFTCNVTTFTTNTKPGSTTTTTTATTTTTTILEFKNKGCVDIFICSIPDTDSATTTTTTTTTTRIELIKRTEPAAFLGLVTGRTSPVTFYGFVLDPLPPSTATTAATAAATPVCGSRLHDSAGTMESKRLIEFVGDSDTAGFGNLCPKSDMTLRAGMAAANPSNQVRVCCRQKDSP